MVAVVLKPTQRKCGRHLAKEENYRGGRKKTHFWDQEEGSGRSWEGKRKLVSPPRGTAHYNSKLMSPFIKR